MPDFADVMSDWVRVMETHSTLLARSTVAAPWGVEMEASQTLVFHLMPVGECWLRLDGHPPLHIQQGDLTVVADGSPHALLDHPEGTPEPVSLFARRPPPPAGSPTSTLICGTFQPEVRLGKHLQQALPPVLHLQASQIAADPSLHMVVQLIVLEIEHPGPGSEVLISHLFDSLLLYVLRLYSRMTDQRPGWLAAMQDPQLSRALTSMHAEPHAPWTVETLAEKAGLSRAAFARRFTERVGEAPLAYLTGWRMSLAARLLSRGEKSVFQVASHVGYTSEAAFSRAFKKHHGMAPATFRRTAS